jgi:hypothetical protein
MQSTGLISGALSRIPRALGLIAPLAHAAASWDRPVLQDIA